MPSVLITGASGFVGEHLARRFHPDYEVHLVYGSQRPTAKAQAVVQVDFSRQGDMHMILKNLSVDVVVHAAALTNPDVCEANPELAKAVNTEGTREVAQWAEDRGARIIYFSTDLVYDGEKGMYDEDDIPRPINMYGHTKLEGEESVKDICSNWAVVRLALSYGPQKGARGDWTSTMRKELAAGRDLYLFTDQVRTPAYAGDTAEAVYRLAGSSKTGVYHMGGRERLSRYDFGVQFARVFGLPAERFHPTQMKDMPMKAPRPKDCSLTTDKISSELAISPCTVVQGLTLQKKEEEDLATG